LFFLNLFLGFNAQHRIRGNETTVNLPKIYLFRELKNSLMNQPPATSYDWICDKCQYENFAKVSNIFYKIKRDKNATNV
jgi:hypothetical protein